MAQEMEDTDQEPTTMLICLLTQDLTGWTKQEKLEVEGMEEVLVVGTEDMVDMDEEEMDTTTFAAVFSVEMKDIEFGIAIDTQIATSLRNLKIAVDFFIPRSPISHAKQYGRGKSMDITNLNSRLKCSLEDSTLF